jgi:hypothetical protein
MILTRQQKIDKWEEIYSDALDVIKKGLGGDKKSVYSACVVIQTASRELGVIFNVMQTLGELPTQRRDAFDTIGWAEVDDPTKTTDIAADA